MQGNEKAAGKKKEKGQKKSWFEGLKAEFRKIIWTDRNTLIKQTIVVLVATIILCAMISIMDSVILQGVNFMVK